MKTAISISDEVFSRADHAAKRLGLSRSELYGRALVEYLDRHAPDELTARIDEAIRAAGQPADPLVIARSRRVIEDTEW